MALKQPVKINLGHTELKLRNDSIIQINSTDRTYTVADIKEIHKAVSQLSNNQKALLLLSASNYTLIDIDAKKFLSTPEAGLHSIAEAYVIKSLAQRLILNFLIKVHGTPVPVRFFTEIHTAIAWLNNFKPPILADQ
ncbi:MAG: hypothetical protein HY062_05510 [Bacteroidetes bacterium]|nr:hypothetical protein [Bacteroidota bacterium]